MGLRTSAVSMMLLAGLTGIMVGCKKNGSKKSEFVDHIKIERGDASFNYVTTFGSNLEVDIEGEYPINQYGSIVFFNDGQHRLNVGVSAHYSLWEDLNLKEVKSLPNGANFPMIVTGSLYSLQIDKNIWAYVQKNSTNGKQVLAGVALQLDGIKNNFPQITITQSFWKGDIRYASFTIYGPRKKNGVEIPGGIFLVGDTAQVIDEATGGSSSVNSRNHRVQLSISGPDAHKFQNILAQRRLMKTIKSTLAQEGIRFVE